MTLISIVDYGIGNLQSISNMFKKGGTKAAIVTKKEELENASKIVLPGMGHFDNCMIKLRASGLLPVLEQKAIQQKTPVLGICVGLQMFMAFSEEGHEPGLNWVSGKTIRFRSEQLPPDYKIPNLGWLKVKNHKHSPLWSNLDDARFYFAHSYHVQLDFEKDILAEAEYGYKYTVALEKENIFGVQFHPEKSHRFGMQLLKNFAAL